MSQIDPVAIIIPDVHEQIGKLKRILFKYPEQTVIFLGDFMDSFNGLTEDTHATLRWLGDNIGNERFRFCFGNHDIHYAYASPRIRSSGYHTFKQILSVNYVGRRLWDQFYLYQERFGYLISHAGFHPHTLALEPSLPVGESSALEAARDGYSHPWLEAGFTRGGSQMYGGCTWLDWGEEFRPIPGIHQIVGHSRGEVVREKNLPNSQNICLDTDLNDIIEVSEDEELKVVDLRGF